MNVLLSLTFDILHFTRNAGLSLIFDIKIKFECCIKFHIQHECRIEFDIQYLTLKFKSELDIKY